MFFISVPNVVMVSQEFRDSGKIGGPVTFSSVFKSLSYLML